MSDDKRIKLLYSSYVSLQLLSYVEVQLDRKSIILYIKVNSNPHSMAHNNQLTRGGREGITTLDNVLMIFEGTSILYIKVHSNPHIKAHNKQLTTLC